MCYVAVDTKGQFRPLVIDNNISVKTLAIAVGEWDGYFYVVSPGEHICSDYIDVKAYLIEHEGFDEDDGISTVYWLLELANELGIDFSKDSFVFLMGEDHRPHTFKNQKFERNKEAFNMMVKTIRSI